MTPSQLRAKVVAERVAWIRRRLADLRVLPLDTYTRFESDPRNPAAAESHLRRALEALLDLGRHLLAKGFGAKNPGPFSPQKPPSFASEAIGQGFPAFNLSSA